MPLRNYGILAGRVVRHQREAGLSSPHYQIQVDGGGTAFRVAVNVLSAQSPSELLYLADEDFRHPLLDGLAQVRDGFTPVQHAPGGIALDFIRGNLFDRARMRPLAPDAPGPDNDLADVLDSTIARAENDENARAYAFGERWGPEAAMPDKIFGFLPGNGVHDIHMNQGNGPGFARDDGVWQDGAVLVHFPGASRWVAIFLAFQSQSWVTDDVTGHAVAPPSESYGRIRVVAALVNPAGQAPEAETVTLLNTTAAPVGLAGWFLVDRGAHRFPLPAVMLPAGEAVRVPLGPPVALGNNGGTISLVDAEGRKADGVSYTASDAAEEGRTIVF